MAIDFWSKAESLLDETISIGGAVAEQKFLRDDSSDDFPQQTLAPAPADQSDRGAVGPKPPAEAMAEMMDQLRGMLPWAGAAVAIVAALAIWRAT